ncbi:MAG: endopeptidase La [Candidatus Oxydemutatoraceae bacterium WSBS_2016_MAG_OTU14]
MSKEENLLPVLPLRDVVVYPGMVTSLYVGRQKSVNALDIAMEKNKEILLVAQKDPADNDPTQKQVYTVGIVASLLQILKLPDNTIKVLAEGNRRVKISRFHEDTEHHYMVAKYEPLESILFEDSRKEDAALRSLVTLFTQFVKTYQKSSHEILSVIAGISNVERLIDTVAFNITASIEQKQNILEIENVQNRLEYMLGIIENEAQIMQMEQRIRGNVKQQMEKSQREYYLNEQMKAIQKELGGLDEGELDEHDEYTDKIKKSGMPKETKAKAVSELGKLDMMPPMSAEATVVRNYLDWLVSVPWKKKTKLKMDLQNSEKILNEDHYGLEKVKERIGEYLAVQQRVKKLKGPILCLVGSPGVGKTSLGRSIARATGRKFTRMSLGGVRDEAEIRGHRRTYIGSMPGKFIQNLSKVGVRNPLFLLDEIDKMAMDFRGDPASALLEVLDPEQNSTFQDHYMETDFDLSDVMFICTANSLNIPRALLDRMEVIHISGYTEDEKKNIAMRYLVQRQLEENGLSKDEINFSADAILHIVRYYTREAGVRNLNREIAKICRKVVRMLLLDKGKPKKPIRINARSSEKYLGVRRYHYGLAGVKNQVGQVTGLAWTEAGGDLLTIEATSVPGKGKLVQTGQLGDVMQESITASMTVVRNRAKSLGIKEDFYEKQDMHVHVPEGATPKDGPSAGITMCTAMISQLTGIPVKVDVAMTGEITLRGEVLEIGGLKEKLIAALRGNLKTVIIPKENEKDLREIPSNILKNLDIRPVKWIEQALEIALERSPVQKVKGVLDHEVLDEGKEYPHAIQKGDWSHH